MIRLDEPDVSEKLPDSLYVIFQNNWGWEIVGKATDEATARRIMVNADARPKSGRVVCRLYRAGLKPIDYGLY